MSKKNELAILPTEETAEKLNEVIMSVIGSEKLNGFRKAYLMAEGIKKLRELLTPEYMGPIMQLQGSRLGFRTDKDLKDDKTPGPGYPMEVVKNCVIEATLNGLQVTGNQFNIIAGNMYPTKEGCGYILNNFKGLKHQIVISLPRMSNDGKSAAVDASIKWSLNEESFEETVPIGIRVNAYMGIDAIIGKATRKARAWLISRITGQEVTDGEIEDVKHTVVNESKKPDTTKEEDERDRWLALFNDCKAVEELEFYKPNVPDELLADYEKRLSELTQKSSK